MTTRARSAKGRRQKAEGKRQAEKREKIAYTPADPTRPIGKGNPPKEAQFGEGNRASVGHGRPRKIDELKELIYEILAENLRDPDGHFVSTRAQAMVRLGLMKNPVPFLEYAFGKVKQPYSVEPSEELMRILSENGLTLEDAKRDPVLNSLFALTGKPVDVGSESGSGTPAAGAGGDGEEHPAESG